MKNMVRACLDRSSHALRRLLQNGAFLLILLFCLLYLPFLNQAFHIDDTGFIEPSRIIGWNPLQVKIGENQYDYGVSGDQGHTFSLPYSISHPIFLSYVIKVVTAIFGENEVPLHTVFMAFSILALVSLAKLTDIWFPGSSERKYVMLALFLAMPAFLVNSHTIMSDVPTISFVLTAVLFFVRSFEKNGSAINVYAGSIFLFLSVFTTYQMLVFIPLLALYAVLKRRMTVSTILSLLFPFVLLSVWLYLVYRLYHYFPITEKDFAGRGSGIAAEIMKGYLPIHFVKKIVSVFTTTAASLFFVQAIRYLDGNSMNKVIRRVSLIAAGSFFPLLFLFRYNWGTTALISLFTAGGYITLRDIAVIGFRSMDTEHRAKYLFFMTWIAVIIGYNVFILPFGSARYLLPALVPMFLILLYDAKTRFHERSLAPVVKAAVVAASAFAFVNAYADYRHASSYRDMTHEMQIHSQKGGRSRTVWYIGAWGMHHYMSAAGFKRLPQNPDELKKGDYVIVPDMPKFYEASPEVRERLKLIKTREYRSMLPLRVFNRQSRAGFYSVHWGLLPFAISLKPDEVFQIWEVVQ